MLTLSKLTFIDTLPVTIRVDPISPYEQRCPFDYHHATNAELEPFIGAKWVIGKATAAMRERYPNSNIVSPKAYAEAVRKAIEARGYARLAEKTIRDLLSLLARNVAARQGIQARDDGRVIIGGRDILGEIPEIAAAREILTKARTP